jgi:predicted nucleic acid-binding protein
MNAVFTDTSAWYALINPRDAHHQKARRFLDAHAGALITSNYIVAETANLTRYRLGTAPALEFLEILRQTTLVEMVFVTPQQHERTVSLFAQYASKGLSFTDCSSLVLMQDHGLRQTFCFDADFVHAGVTCVP